VAGRADTARLLAELSLVDKFSPGVNSALKSVGRLETGVGRVGKGFGQMSAGVARAGTIVAGAAITGLGAAAKAAIDWEDAFTGVVKTVDEADLAKAGLTFDDISNSLRKMSTEMPNTAVELAGIAEAAGAMGIAGKDIEAFTRQVAIMASTTNVAAEEGAVALGQMQNVIGLTADEFDNFVASLVHLGNVGNSTEAQILEIARRSGGAAKLFGIAKDETLGWAAAAANLGLNEELAGTALQKMFLEAMPKYIKGSKLLQKITGQTGAQLKESYEKDAGGAMQSLIKDLSKLDKGARLEAIQSLFGKTSGITRLVNGLADSYAQNLAPSLDGATQSWEEATAAQIEFEKRNATVRSAIARLKNGITDAAVTLGEGFAPAVGRAADKLAKFLGDDANRSAIKSIGEDIGAAIDGIDWQQVLDGAKSLAGILKESMGWAKRLFDLFMALPGPIKEAGLGFIAINKLSGGLFGAGVGNVIGGIGETIARSAGSKLPGVGKLFAQPVFVTNFPPGFGAGGGLPGAAAGIGAGTLLAGAAITAAAAGAVIAVQQIESQKNTDFSADIKAGLDSSIFGKTQGELRTALAGVDQGIADLQSNPLHVLVAGDALANLQSMKASLEAQLANPKNAMGGQSRQDNDPDKRQWRNDNPERLVALAKAREASARRQAAEQRDAAFAIRDRVDSGAAEQKSAVDAAKTRLAAAADRGTTVISSTTRSGAVQTAAATRGVAPPIVSAIRSIPAPIVNVSVTAATVTKNITYQNRSGNGNGSSGGGGSHPGAGLA
jgi:TP901 family phage tail tape measure protein